MRQLHLSYVLLFELDRRQVVERRVRSGVLYDYHPANRSAREINRSAYRFEGDGPVSFKMHPRDHIVRAGHRLAFHVTSGHPQFLPRPTQTTVGISKATVTVRS